MSFCCFRKFGTLLNSAGSTPPAPAHVERLDAVSRIEMGFPHDLFAIDMVCSLSSGGMRDQIDA
jgi:hypothetical protein